MSRTHTVRGATTALVVVLAALLLLAATDSGPVAANGPCSRTAGPGDSPQGLIDALGPGDVGCLRAGTYRVGRLRFNHGGRSGAPLTLRSYPGERARLEVRDWIFVPEGSDHVTLQRLWIDGSPGATEETHCCAVKLMAADAALEDSDITNRNTKSSCIIAGSNSGYGTALRTVIRRNRIHDCGARGHKGLDHGVYLERMERGRVEDNVISGSSAFGIQVYPNTQDTVIAHNIIDGSGWSGVILGSEGSHRSSGNVVEHNVISWSARHAVDVYWGGPVGRDNVVRGNCLWRSGDRALAAERGFTASGNVVGDPQFADRARHDYRLRPGSRCRRVVGTDAAARRPHR
jgi:parallel beta-helix repeat protein